MGLMRWVESLFLLMISLNLSAFAVAERIGNTKVSSFRQAKKQLLKIYGGTHQTLYCACPFQGKRVLLEKCSYTPRKDKKRAARIEWEHVVPAHAFGQSFAAWRNGHARCVNGKGKAYRGRRCAQKIHKRFARMEADLYNLYPAVGELNGLRSNYSMAMIPGEKRAFGTCDVEIVGKKIEPRPEIRGDIARVYFYMDRAYPGRGIISKKNQKLLAAWDRQDPVDSGECKRYRLIRAAQKSENPILSARCSKATAVR